MTLLSRFLQVSPQMSFLFYLKCHSFSTLLFSIFFQLYKTTSHLKFSFFEKFVSFPLRRRNYFFRKLKIDRRPVDELLLLLPPPKIEFFFPRVDVLLLLFLLPPPMTPLKKLWLFPRVLLLPYVPVVLFVVFLLFMVL